MSDYRVVRYRREYDIVHGVTKSPGHKYTPIVVLDEYNVRLLKVPNAEATKHFETMDYKLSRAVRGLLRIGRGWTITKEAKDFLKEIK
jgi:hypothetical protein